MSVQKTTKSNFIVAVISLAGAMVPFMSSAINLALPVINEKLSLNARMSGWVVTSYMLATAILQIPCARLADMVGRKRLFGLGIALFSVFSFFAGLTTSGGWLIVWRSMMGLGSAMMFGTGTAILISSVPAEKRGWVLGIQTSVVYMSLAAGPFIGGILTSHFGWSSIFFVAGFIGIITTIGTFIFIKDEWKEVVKSRFDYLGSILYGIGLFCLLYGFSLLPKTTGIILTILGIIFLIAFTKYQSRIDSPVFNIKLFFENKVFRLSTLSALINYSATFAIAFMFSLYLQYVRGLDPKEAGLVLIVQSIIQSVTSLVSGRLSDRISASLLATIGMAIVALGLLLLVFITGTTSFYFLVFILALLGLGFGFFSSPNVNVIMSSVEQKFYSMASATTGTMRLTGQAFSMGIAMMAISLVIGNVKLSPDLSLELLKSMKITFAICTLLCFAGVYTSSVRLKPIK
ncbi:MAG TPA: MFS transporter [Bacteroidales bacterium]|nr:MFS transporter [Bacteroidales bacterium]HQH14634.1 MFS transporter [Bacteroidales bacterium]